MELSDPNNRRRLLSTDSRIYSSSFTRPCAKGAPKPNNTLATHI